MIELLDVPGRRANEFYRAVSVAQGTRLIHIAGQVGDDDAGELVGPDLASQAEQAMRNVHAALAAAGAGPEHLTAMTVYVVGWKPELLSELGAGLRAAGDTPLVPATLIGVETLFAPGYLVEIVATAVV